MVKGGYGNESFFYNSHVSISFFYLFFQFELNRVFPKIMKYQSNMFIRKILLGIIFLKM